MTSVPAALREEVIRRSGRVCEYCRLPDRLQVRGFDVDHIIPQSRGGQTVLENLGYACQSCNGHKWAHFQAVDTQTGERVVMFHPRTDRWDEHFEWLKESEVDVRIVGKTPCGRATVECLQMNEPGVAGIRRDMIEFGILEIPDR